VGKKIIGVIIIILIVSGVVIYLNKSASEKIEQSQPSSPVQITISGEITCLPKIGSGPQTLECALGLKGDDGKYYGLRNLSSLDPEYKFSQDGKQVEVTGILNSEEIKGPDGNKYDITGVIDVTSIKEI
jgi:hypothetical protein